MFFSLKNSTAEFRAVGQGSGVTSMSSVGVQSYQIRFRDRASMHCQAGVENLDALRCRDICVSAYMHIWLIRNVLFASTVSVTVFRHYVPN